MLGWCWGRKIFIITKKVDSHTETKFIDMDITLAIPNFNGLEGLKKLLPQVTKEEFKNIYVLDDCSTDKSEEYVKKFPKVTFVKGKKNLGPPGNRNRILNYQLGDIIFFIDADMELKVRDIKNKIKILFSDKKVGVVGGKILDKKGNPMLWNYGYEMHPIRDALANEYQKLAEKYSNKKDIIAYLRKEAIKYFYNLEILYGEDKERIVDWVAEGNFCVRSDVFRKINGFDPNMRYHETHDFNKRVRKLGKIVKYSPMIVTRHLEIECRKKRKKKDIENAMRYFYRKHWGMSDKIFNLLYDIKK